MSIDLMASIYQKPIYQHWVILPNVLETNTKKNGLAFQTSESFSVFLVLLIIVDIETLQTKVDKPHQQKDLKKHQKKKTSRFLLILYDLIIPTFPMNINWIHE